jgi:hypothetical protein
MKNLPLASIAIGACLLLSSAGVALAKGQPGTNAGVNCGTPGAMSTPGASGSASGSPFSGGTAGNVYANTFNKGGTPFEKRGDSAPLTSTSQYDIACKNVSQIP